MRSLSFGRSAARLRRLSAVLDRVLAGDLTAQVDAGPATDGAVEQKLNEVLRRYATLTATVQEAVDRLDEARRAATATHKQMLDTAEMTAGQAYDVGVTITQVSDGVGVVASATDELNSTISDIARHASEAADVAVAASDQSHQAASGVLELAEALRSVDEIANTIAAIARRTHLLALNAKIEAQRAGVAGRGFAVVAAEVNDLASQTSQATEQVRSLLVGIDERSKHASETIHAISATMARICESTASIAGAVNQQTATTREIGRVSALAAQGAAEIARRISTVHDQAREVAYLGAQKDAPKTEEIGRIERALRQLVDGCVANGFAAPIDDPVERIDQAELNRKGTSTVGNVTTVLDYVCGTGLNEFDYHGSWLHGSGYETDAGGDAYCSVPGDSVSLRFVGRKIRFYGSLDAQQGMAEVWVDNGPRQLVDFYSPVRRAHSLVWESPDLPPGEHVFHLEVSPKKNPKSRYFWASVAKVEIVQ